MTKLDFIGLAGSMSSSEACGCAAVSARVTAISNENSLLHRVLPSFQNLA
jgi:hypothetical protein